MVFNQNLINEPLHEQAYSVLRDALSSGRFKPGQAITIRGLGKELGISATPVREALQRLIAEKALHLKENRTIIVPILTRARFDEITKIRLRLEEMAVQEAIPHIDARIIGELSRSHESMERSLSRREFGAYLAENEHFHFTIYRCSRSQFLLQLIELAWLQIGPWLNMLANEGNFKRAANIHHRQIIDRIIQEDALGAAAAIRADIQDAASHLSPLLEARSQVEERPALQNPT